MPSYLLYFTWRLAPLLFVAAYVWAIRAAGHVLDVIVALEPGWSMPSELVFASAHMTVAALASCAMWVLAFSDADERSWIENLPLWLCTLAAGLILLVVGILAFPAVLAAANQPTICIPIVGVLMACPMWLCPLQDAAQ